MARHANIETGNQWDGEIARHANTKAGKLG